MEYITRFREEYQYRDPLENITYPGFSTHLAPLLQSEYGLSDQYISNIKVVLFGLTLYHSIFLVGQFLLLVTKNFRGTLKDGKSTVDFCIKLVSFFQATLIVILGIPVFNNKHLDMDRVFATVPYTYFYGSLALSYFIWDTLITSYYLKYCGVGFLLHGLVSTMVFGLCTFYPFIHHYAAVFLFFEISTPFLDIRWVGLKFDVLSETFKLINNITLILIFFFIRICWGWYQVTRLVSDFWDAKDHPNFTVAGAILVLSCNFVLNVLNAYWFSKMIIVTVHTLKQMFGKTYHDDKLKLM